MLTAIDTEGRSYFALSQGNTNIATFRIFFRDLVRCLDRDIPNWRLTSVIQLDGAPYHTADKTVRLYKELNAPVIISSPYSYDASPIELYFANFKKGNLNISHVPTSKSKYTFPS